MHGKSIQYTSHHVRTTSMLNSYLPAGSKRGLHESDYTFIYVLHTFHACDKNNTPHRALVHPNNNFFLLALQPIVDLYFAAL